jgi:hypothetical protein
MKRLHGTYTLFLAACLALLPASWAVAQRVEFVLKVLNPSDMATNKEVVSSLPAGITTNDILDLGGFELRYSMSNKTYSVFKNIALPPKELVEAKVVLKDIWSIPREETRRLKDMANSLVSTLKDLPPFADAQELNRQIQSGLTQVEVSQQAAVLETGASVKEHIQAHERDIDRLDQIKRDIRKIENLVLRAGRDPDDLVWESETPPQPTRQLTLKPEDYKETLFEIMVANTAVFSKRDIAVNHPLPAEVRISDVLDNGGLEIRSEPDGSCFARTNLLEVPPGSRVVYTLRIRDKWNVNGPRMALLKQDAGSLLERITLQRKYPKVEVKVQEIMARVEGMEKEPAPEKLDVQYVAYYRDQAHRLDVIEQRISRLKEMLQPILAGSKFGFNAPPPSSKTTWLIIYTILGFLFLISLLFFIRWFGGEKNRPIETLSQQMPREDGEKKG